MLTRVREQRSLYSRAVKGQTGKSGVIGKPKESYPRSSSGRRTGRCHRRPIAFASMLADASTYDEVYCRFCCSFLTHYNLGVDVCDRWAEADPGRPATRNVKAHDSRQGVRLRRLREGRNRLANVL